MPPVVRVAADAPRARPDRFRREDDSSLSRYFEKKSGIGTSIDGLPGLPLPLPALPAPFSE